jgi:predicted 3-demethylubiquinone-9 3-methyltransferase (glyoxalase superfamily)
MFRLDRTPPEHPSIEAPARHEDIPTMKPITPCLWFDDEAEAAAAFYTGLFPNSRIVRTSYYGEEGHEVHGQPAGKVLTVAFELNGQPFTALNGGPRFTLNEAVSFQIACDDQTELDRYWDALLEGGGKPVQCGWLKDRFGVSWQVFPSVLIDWLQDKDKARAGRVMKQMIEMVKLDVAPLRRAYGG